MAQTIDEPRLSDDLHPGADAGRAGSEPHQTEIAIVKGLEYSAKCSSFHALRTSRMSKGLSSHEQGRSEEAYIALVVIGREFDFGRSKEIKEFKRFALCMFLSPSNSSVVYRVVSSVLLELLLIVAILGLVLAPTRYGG